MIDFVIVAADREFSPLLGGHCGGVASPGAAVPNVSGCHERGERAWRQTQCAG
jgi:hypothetical protein